MTQCHKKAMSADKALERLMALCANAEHCRYEMKVKLTKWGIFSEDASRIIDRLCREKFIDDRRFAIAYATDKARFNAWGSRKIRLGLMRKQISDTHIATALASVDPEDFRLGLLQTIKNKTISLGPEESLTYEGRTKIFRHAASRGYEPEMIIEILSDRRLMEELM